QGGNITAVLRPPQDNASTQKAVRGDLASLLGVNRAPPAPGKKAQVIYGNQSVRSVSRLKPAPSAPPQTSGLFNLPHAQELVSAWIHSSMQHQLHEALSGRDALDVVHADMPPE